MSAWLRPCLPPLLSLLALLLAAGLPCSAQAQQVDRSVLQAAYVMNFLNYSEWPAAQAAPLEEVTVLVLAPPSVVRTFRDTARAASERGPRRVRVRGIDPSRLGDPQQLERRLQDVHAVFVAGGDAVLVDAVIGSTRGKPVLTIGEGHAFVQRGGMLSFLRDGGNLVFTSNVQAVLESPVRLSSKVLRLARDPTGLPEEGAHALPAHEGLALLLHPAGALGTRRPGARG